MMPAGSCHRRGLLQDAARAAADLHAGPTLRGREEPMVITTNPAEI